MKNKKIKSQDIFTYKFAKKKLMQRCEEKYCLERLASVC
jgi:hypothetical protein